MNSPSASNKSNFELEVVLKAFYQLNITGNVIPQQWYKKITLDNGKPDLNAILILAEIVYWYRPVEEKDQFTGKFLGIRAKFKGDMLKRSIKSFSNQFGLSDRQVMDALKRLSEKHKLIIKELRILERYDGTKEGNQLFIAPIVASIAALQENPTLMQSNAIGVDDLIHNDPSCNQSHKVMQTVTVDYVKERSSIYRKETTQESIRENKEAAAKQKLICEENEVDHKKNAAASLFSFNLQKKDFFIQEALTQKQLAIIHQAASEYATKISLSVAELEEDIKLILLNPKRFKECESDFRYKLFTVLKMYRDGLLVPKKIKQKLELQQNQVQNQIKEKANEKIKKISEISLAIRECQGNITAIENLLSIEANESAIKSLKNSIEKNKFKIERLIFEREACQANYQGDKAC